MLNGPQRENASKLRNAILEYTQNKNEDAWNVEMPLWYINGPADDATTIEDLRFPIQEGEHKGKTAIWLAVAAENKGFHVPLAYILRRFKSELTLDDFRVTAEAGKDEGISSLWILFNRNWHSRSEYHCDDTYKRLWLLVRDKFKKNFTAEDIRAKPNQGENKGQSLLWHAIDHFPFNLDNKVYNNNSFFFIKELIDYHGVQLTIEDFRVPTETGATPIYLIIEGATVHFQHENVLWRFLEEKFGSELRLDDFRFQPPAIDEYYMPTGIGFSFIDGVGNQRKKTLAFIKKHFLSELKTEDFLTKSAGKTIVQVIKRDKRRQQEVGCFVDFLFALHSFDWSESTSKEKRTEDFYFLFRLAEKAEERGFHDVYYMAAMNEKIKLSLDARLAFLSRVTKNSKYFEKASVEGFLDALSLLSSESGFGREDLFIMAAACCYHSRDFIGYETLFIYYAKKMHNIGFSDCINIAKKYQFEEKTKSFHENNDEGSSHLIGSFVISQFELLLRSYQQDELEREIKESRISATPMYHQGRAGFSQALATAASKTRSKPTSFQRRSSL